MQHKQIIKIRRAQSDDADTLTALSMLSKQSNGYDHAFMTLCVDELKVTPKAMQDGTFWVAETDIICGLVCIYIQKDAPIGQIRSFFIHPDYQKQGIGKLLWSQILTYAKKNKLTKLHLDSDPFAEPFYKKLGFHTVGQIPSDKIVGRTLPYMELALAPI